MEKKELKKKLDEQVKLLKTQCKDAKFAKTLIDDLLSLKGQYDIKTDTREVVSEIKQSAYRITKYDNDDIEFHINGFTTIIKPQLNVYHFPFDALLSIHNNIDKLTDEDKENYQSLLTNTLLIMQMPTIVFSEPELFSSVLIPYTKYLNNMMDKAVDDDNLPKDDEARNEEFKKEVEFKEELKRELDAKDKND